MSGKSGMRNSGGGIAVRDGAAARSAAGRTQRVKFEAIAINSVAKKKPTAEDAAHYIGLEHIDPGCFVVSRWGGDVAPIGDKLLMKKGDVLFGRRRAYQRKVAIAPFDGIFSAHGMVLRPKTDVVDEKFFPFFIASDQFMNEAVRISVGGLSPTINWKTLKECEFTLPPLSRQRELADLLWAANDLKESYKKAITATDEMLKAKFREMFGNRQYGEFDDFCRILRGEYITKNSAIAGQVPVILGGREPAYYIDHANHDGECIVISRSGASAGYVTYWNQPVFVTDGFIIEAKDNADIKFAYHYYDNQYKRLSKDKNGSAIPHVTSKIIKGLGFPCVPLSIQREFVSIAEKAESAKAALKKSIAAIDQVMKGLINQ